MQVGCAAADWYSPTAQSKQATVDAVEYLPTAQAAHVVAPVLASSFVIEPAAHTTQSLAVSEPVVPIYFPAVHSVHAATLDAVEYFPVTHSVHSVAPGLAPLLVIEPAPHGVHAATFDPLEYVPAAHAMHELAPTTVPKLVRDPAKHTLQ
jgi:hypothetical protein